MRILLVSLALAAFITAAPAAPPFGPPGYDARPISYLDSTSAIVHWQTATPCATRLQIREGVLPASTPGDEAAWDAPRVIEGSAVPKRDHALHVTGLKPATRYFYRAFDPASEADERERTWSADPPWSREYAFATRAAEGETTFVRIPMKTLIVPNVINLSTVEEDTPLPEPMSDAELELYRRHFRESVLFYWVNSSMRYWLDCDFFVEPEWQRLGDEREDLPDFYKGWPHKRDGLRVFDTADISNHDAKAPLTEDTIYSALTIVICERRWNPEKKEWYYQGSGGGTFGIDWMLWGDKTQVPAPGRSTYLGGSDIAWLNTHEYHHQKESQHHFSGLVREDDRVVFDHFAPRYVTPTDNWKWDTAFAHGEHYDGIAWELRMLTTPQYFRNMFGEVLTAKDTDSDGIPDDDARLPLDEKRLGSDPASAMSDGRVHDMERILGARWVPANLTAMRERIYNPGYEPMFAMSEGLTPPVFAKGSLHYAWIDFRSEDSDRDGLVDAEDPYPIYPWNPAIAQASPVVDGELADWDGIDPIGAVTYGKMSAVMRSALDKDNLYYALEIDGPYRSLLIHVDGDADGWYVGNDNLQIRIASNEESGLPELQEAIAHICGNRGWPYFDNGNPIQWTDRDTKDEWSFERPRWYGDKDGLEFAASADGAVQRLELAIPNGKGTFPIQAGPGHPIGLAVYVSIPDKGAVSMYEPYTFFVAEVGKAPAVETETAE